MRRGATGRQDAEAETGTEERAGGTGHPAAHPTGAAAAASVGGPVTAGNVPTEEKKDGGAGHPTEKSIGTAPAASVGGPVSAGPTLDEEDTQREEGGDETPRRAREETDPVDGETEERGPPDRSRAPNTSGRRGEKGRWGTPTQQRAPMACSKGAEGGAREAQRENPPRGGLLEPEGGPQRAIGE